MHPISFALALLASTTTPEPSRSHWVDLDGDGDQDLVLVGANRDLQLMRNAGKGSFADATETSGLGGLSGIVQAAFADYDQDGRVDLIALSKKGEARIYRNSTSGLFTSVGKESGLDLTGAVASAAWIDFDQDKKLDLELQTAKGPRLFRNVGNGAFASVALTTTGSGSLASTATSSSSGSATFFGAFAQALRDALVPGLTIEASTIPTLGMLTPLSQDFFISDSTGNVGIGNTDPATALDVAGTIRARSGGIEFPDGSLQSSATLQGPIGPQGPAGNDGVDGVDGADGAVGPAGPTGAQGSAGSDGADGADGAAGPAGPTGAQGPAGSDGADGADGAAGPAGPTGAQGPAGSDGADGAAGPAGPTGAQGPAGNDGADGADGAIGPAGPTGAQGPAGNDGADGADGAIGPAGPTGAQGPAGSDGADGADGAVGPAGPTGAQGPAGNDGADGADGAVGPAGPTGAQGPAGAQGPIGLQGLAGNDGATGPAGPTGPQGPTGIAGTDGAPGAVGPVGPQGAQGEAGSGTPLAPGAARFHGGNFEIATRPVLLDAEFRTGGGADSGNNQAWQSFTALTNGELVAVDLMRANTSTNLTVNVYDGEGTAGTLLATSSAGPRELNAAGQWATASLPEAIQLVAGSRYTIEAFSDAAMNWLWRGQDMYAGGISEVTGRDYQFRTWILDPADDGELDAALMVDTQSTFIGLGNTNPTTQLDVSGTVRSRSGGFQFPDGSIQTTATPQGPQGDPGPIGPQGPAGNDGATGPAGPTGPQGPAGADGTNGVDGATGPAGPTGAQGPIGLMGPAGDEGPIGPAGAAGPAGPMGPAGATGPAGSGSPWTINGSDLVYNAGAVGVGVTTPTTPFALQGNGGTSPVGITQNGVGGTSTMELTTGDSVSLQATRLMLRGADNDADVEFYRGGSGSEQVTMFIEGTNGSVGIGNSNPTQPLDVNGVVRSRSGGFEFPDGSIQDRAAYGASVAATGRFRAGSYEIATRPLLVDAQHFANSGNTLSGSNMWQSFTANSTGSVAAIGVVRALATTFVTMRVYAGSGTGGTLLATAAVPPRTPNIAGQWTTAEFDEKFNITAGSVYTIRLTGGSVRWLFNDGNPYAGGQSNLGSNRDHQFRVWMFDPADDGELDPAIVVENNTGHVGIGRDNPTHPLHMQSGAHVTSGGVWTNASSRGLKENFTSVDARSILQQVRELELTRWNYKTVDDSVVHLGPMAEDFYEAFGLGASDASIGTIDANGVALASIQALASENAELKKELRLLREAVQALVSPTE